MKKILAILIALLAALAVQTVAFADGEMMPLQPASTQSETSSGTAVPVGDLITVGEINYTVLTVPSGEENGTVEVGVNFPASGDITIPAIIVHNGQTYTVTSIGDYAFANCRITSVYIPDSVTSIGDGAFGNSSIYSVYIPDSVTSIGDRAFLSCSGLPSIDIPDSVTSIGDYAFTHCAGLTSVTIPGSVTSIGDYAFYYTGLTSITFEGINPPSFDLNAFDDRNKLQTISLSADMTQAQRDSWTSALELAGFRGQTFFNGNLISDPTPDPTPTTPPADTNTAAEAASTPTVQQMEQRERPDPQDVEATERYNFWMGVKADLRAAADGKTLRVYVPADYTNMPASVMEQIRLLDADVTVDLRWNGERLAITPATAQRKTALKAFWTFAQLCELYAQ